MKYETILFGIKNGIATVILNRPQKLNALNDQMADELLEVLNVVNNENKIKVLVISGMGNAFCSGADIKERFLSRIEKIKKGGLLDEIILGYAEKLCLSLISITKPVLVALNGITIGIGTTIALACDIRIASETMKMGFGFVNMGVTPEVGSSYFLPRLVGLGKANELLFTGNTIDALEAKNMNLVNQVVPYSELMSSVYELAEKISKKPVTALKLAKQLLFQGLYCDLRTQLRLETLALEFCRNTMDHDEAVKAFLEKRLPVFGE